MKYAQHNQNAIAEIRQILIDHHKKGSEIAESADMLTAWAVEAEDRANADAPGGYIELSQFESASGHTELYDLDAAGMDWIEE